PMSTHSSMHRFSLPGLFRGALAALALAGGIALMPAGWAQDSAANSLKLFLERETTGLPGRVEISIGSLDPRLNLAPCERVEPFMPPGTRLMGKTMLGLRCLDAPAWVAYLPVEIR